MPETRYILRGREAGQQFSNPLKLRDAAIGWADTLSVQHRCAVEVWEVQNGGNGEVIYTALGTPLPTPPNLGPDDALIGPHGEFAIFMRDSDSTSVTKLTVDGRAEEHNYSFEQATFLYNALLTAGYQPATKRQCFNAGAQIDRLLVAQD